jgi:5'-deoxynucleotidase YfbR-like HD superfamily hydrolase
MKRTKNGYFDYLNPSAPNCDLSWDSVAWSLSATPRFGASGKRLTTVGQHSLAVYLAVVQYHPKNLMAQMYALVHDAAEAYTGDMVKPWKNAMDERYPHPEVPHYWFENNRIEDALFKHWKIAPSEEDVRIVKEFDYLEAELEYGYVFNNRSNFTREAIYELSREEIYLELVKDFNLHYYYLTGEQYGGEKAVA